MKTSPISPAAPGAVRAAGMLAAADGDGATEQAVAEFHQQRAGALRPVPRLASAPPAHNPRSRNTVRAQAPRQLESAVLAAVECIARGGTEDLEHWLSGCGFDALEKATLLQAVAARGEPERRQVQPLLDRLAQQDLLAQAVQAPASTDGRPDGDPADVRRPVAGDPGLRRAGADSARVWAARREAASFNLLQSCYHYGADLHAALRKAGALDGGGGMQGVARAARGLLRAGEVASGELADLVGIAPAAQERGALRLLAAAVRQLPLTLWPGDKERSALLASLDAGPVANSPDTDTADTRLARDLHATWAARHG